MGGGGGVVYIREDLSIRYYLVYSLDPREILFIHQNTLFGY